VKQVASREYGDKSQKIELVITTVIRTLNPTILLLSRVYSLP
jgi:hypothetical protein